MNSQALHPNGLPTTRRSLKTYDPFVLRLMIKSPSLTRPDVEINILGVVYYLHSKILREASEYFDESLTEFAAGKTVENLEMPWVSNEREPAPFPNTPASRPTCWNCSW